MPSALRYASRQLLRSPGFTPRRHSLISQAMWQQAREAMNVIAAGYQAAKPANIDAPSRIEVVLAVLGGVAGLLLAEWALTALVTFGADLILRVAEIRIDPIALGFSLVATLVTGLAIGLLPALQDER